MIPFKSKIQLSKKQILLQNNSMRTLSSKAGILQKLSRHDRLKQYFNGSLERSASSSSLERVQSNHEEALLIIIVTIVLPSITTYMLQSHYPVWRTTDDISSWQSFRSAHHTFHSNRTNPQYATSNWWRTPGRSKIIQNPTKTLIQKLPETNITQIGRC